MFGKKEPENDISLEKALKGAAINIDEDIGSASIGVIKIQEQMFQESGNLFFSVFPFSFFSESQAIRSQEVPPFHSPS